ncbi:MAG: ATP-binding protein [Candidatus Competibacteraceae bacterium]
MAVGVTTNEELITPDIPGDWCCAEGNDAVLVNHAESGTAEMIANGENSGVEFKRDDIRLEQLAKEIVAFANVQGGRILFGC